MKTTLEAIHHLRTVVNEISATLDFMTRQIKKDGNQECRPSIEVIQRCVANFYDVPVQCMTLKARPRHWSIPRQIAMYLCRVHLSYSFEEIGRCFGNRDHGTIAYAVEQVQQMKTTQPHFGEKLEAVNAAVVAQLKKEDMPLFTE